MEEVKETFLKKWGPLILWVGVSFLGGNLTGNMDRIYDFVVTGQERLEFVEDVLEEHESRLDLLEKANESPLESEQPFSVEK